MTSHRLSCHDLSDDANAACQVVLRGDPPASLFPGLRLNLGLPQWSTKSLVTLEKTWGRSIVGLVSALVTPLELAICPLLLLLPQRPMSKLMTTLFKVLVLLWARLPKAIRCRGTHDDLSPEAHLLSVFMWTSRLLPVNLRRVRFGMRTLPWLNPHESGIKEEVIDVPEFGVKGLWLSTAPRDVEDPPVLMWIFGGACVAGEVHGNKGLAARYARAIGADTFLVDYRLLPEHSMEDGLLDGCHAYEWLLTRKAPNKIFAGGLSAGAAILLRALQAAASRDPKERSWAFRGSGPTPQPAGALLIGPFVDFTVPLASSSMKKNVVIDWVVTQGVLEFCTPVFVAGAGSKMSTLRSLSPTHKDMRGLCPIFLTYSQHEVVTDQSNELFEKLKAAGNEVEAHTEKYLGHVFQVFSLLLPEAERTELAAKSWLARRKEVVRQEWL